MTGEMTGVKPLTGDNWTTNPSPPLISTASMSSALDQGWVRGCVQRPVASEPALASPETLYQDLPRKPGAVPGLCPHQGEILPDYAAAHTDTPDVALELPTGTGKRCPAL